jgi:hypothetical protein
MENARVAHTGADVAHGNHNIQTHNQSSIMTPIKALTHTNNPFTKSQPESSSIIISSIALPHTEIISQPAKPQQLMPVLTKPFQPLLSSTSGQKEFPNNQSHVNTNQYPFITNQFLPVTLNSKTETLNQQIIAFNSPPSTHDPQQTNHPIHKATRVDRNQHTRPSIKPKPGSKLTQTRPKKKTKKNQNNSKPNQQPNRTTPN